MFALSHCVKLESFGHAEASVDEGEGSEFGLLPLPLLLRLTLSTDD